MRRFGVGRDRTRKIVWNRLSTGRVIATRVHLDNGQMDVIYDVYDEPGPGLSDEETRALFSAESPESCQPDAGDRVRLAGCGNMVYKAQDPAMLNAVKPGDKIKFDADQVNGQYTVTKIEKSGVTRRCPRAAAASCALTSAFGRGRTGGLLPEASVRRNAISAKVWTLQQYGTKDNHDDARPHSSRRPVSEAQSNTNPPSLGALYCYRPTEQLNCPGDEENATHAGLGQMLSAHFLLLDQGT
jgi:hypothetical protein